MRDSLSLIKLRTQHESLHGLTLGAGTARLLSVPRFGGCGYGDVVRFAGDVDDPEILVHPIVEVIEHAGYALHEIHGPAIDPGKAMALTEKCREADLHIEVWSLTMAGGSRDALPLHAGLALAPSMDPLEARLRLRHAALQAGVTIAAPTLSRAAGDEIGAARDRRTARQLGIAA